MATIIQVKDLINGTNKEDWHHFTVTPRSKKQAEELRDAFEEVVKKQGEGTTEEDKRICEYIMGMRKHIE